MKTANPPRNRILLIGDTNTDMRAALDQAIPGVEVTLAPTVFDGLAELVANRYSAVLANAEPIERRPEAAVRELRQLAGDSRVVVFGGATLEPLARKMLDFGVDDYVVTPVEAGELGQVLAPRVRQPEKPAQKPAAAAVATIPPTAPTSQPFSGLASVPPRRRRLRRPDAAPRRRHQRRHPQPE